MQTVICPKCKNKIPVQFKPRSLKENNYYWDQVVGNISDHTGFTPEEAHEALKWKFLRIVKGKMETVRSTTALTTSEFEDYLTKIRVWAAEELNIYIPLPREDLREN